MLPVYYINLAARPDRRAFMERQFSALGIPAIRVEGVTPAEITQADVDAFCSPGRRGYLLKNQLACSLSHERAWRDIIAQGQPRAAVFEDDVVLSASLPHLLSGGDIPDCAVLRLETALDHKRYLPGTPIAAGIAARKCLSPLGGSAGYVITASAANLLLHHPQMRQTPVDVVLFHPFLPAGRAMQVLHADPALCIQLGNIRSQPSHRSEAVGEAAILPPGRDEADPIRIQSDLRGRALRWLQVDVPKTFAQLRHAREAKRITVRFDGNLNT